LILLQKNLELNSGGSTVVATLPTCLTITGTIEAPTAGIAGVIIYYPDWNGQSGTCLSDGNEPLYMKRSNYWLSDSLEKCCEQNYGGTNKNLCMHADGSGLWYVSDALGKCVKDCKEKSGETCGGLVNLASGDLFIDPKDCCETKLSWFFNDFCVADSLSNKCYVGTGRWYRGDIVGSEVCVRDCDPVDGVTASCGGLVEDSYVLLHDSAESCCSAEYAWMNELCVFRSNNTATDKYWPDETQSRCFKDSEKPAKDLGLPLFESAIECCQTYMVWLSEASCVSASDIPANGTYKFFVHWESEQCGKDCVGPAPCTGLAQRWNDLYETESSCCDMLPWLGREDCVYTGISKTSEVAGELVVEVAGSVYYPDWIYHTGTCLDDGNEPTYMNMNKVWVSSSLEECCNKHYSGWNKDACMSGEGSG